LKKLLIIGRGQIGSALGNILGEQGHFASAHNGHAYEVHYWEKDMDALSTDALLSILPDAVINTAGKTDLAWCEANAREAVRCNLEAPVRLYERIRNIDHPIRYIHFSSGCIWDGPYTPDGRPFTPTMPPSPACLYSWTKAAADAMLMNIDKEHIAILRPRQVYSGALHLRNTLVKLMKYPKLVDTPNSVSSMAVIEKTVRYLLTHSEASGIWNVYDRGVITPFQIGEMLWQTGVRTQPQKISKDELDRFHTPKRVDTVLYDERFERCINPENVEAQLHRAIDELRHAIELQAASEALAA